MADAPARPASATGRTFRLVRFGIAAAALVLATPSANYLRLALQRERALDKDFGQEYLLARALIDGINPYLPIRDLAARYLSPTGLLDKPFPTPHPPTAGVLFIPFVALDYATAVQVWTVIELLCVPLSVVLAVRVAGLRIGYGWIVVIALSLFGWTPVLVDIALAQLTLAMVVLLAASQLLLTYRRDALSGVLLGVALALKPLAWPWLIVLAWRRRWSALLGALAIVALLLAIAATRVGLAPLVAYVTQVTPNVSASYALEPTNISLWTLGPRMLGEPPPGRVVGFAVPAVVLLASVLWFAVRRPRTSRALSVLLCVSVVVSPIDWDYDLVLLVVPLVSLAADLHRRGFPRWPTIAAGIVAVALYIPLPVWPFALGPTFMAVALACLLALSGEPRRAASQTADSSPPVATAGMSRIKNPGV